MLVAQELLNFRGQAFCFDKMTSPIHIALEQKTIVLQNIKGKCPPLSPSVSANDIKVFFVQLSSEYIPDSFHFEITVPMIGK